NLHFIKERFMTSTPRFALMLPGLTSKDGPQIADTNPYNNQQLATVELADKAAVETALPIAHALFTDRPKWLPVPQRQSTLVTSLSVMQQQSEELAQGAAAEGGKPLVDSRIEMARCIDSIRHCMEALRHQASHAVPMGINPASQHRLTMLHKEPIGVVVAISA